MNYILILSGVGLACFAFKYYRCEAPDPYIEFTEDICYHNGLINGFMIGVSVSAIVVGLCL